jgi:integrase
LADYRTEYRQLIERSNPDTDAGDFSRLSNVILWFSRQDGVWSAATIRKYRASLRLAIEDWATAAPDADEIRVWRLQSDLDHATPAPRDKKSPPQTSAKKRLKFTQSEHEVVATYLASTKSSTSHRLVGLLAFGVRFGLRPHEWLYAYCRDNVLVVRCAKRTNGRGVADTRLIDLSDMGAARRRELSRFIHSFQNAAAREAVWQRFYERLSKSLARACEKLDVPKICLYSLRHQAIATAKRYMTRAEVAALAGHATVATAARHYARRSGGWRVDPRIRPSPSTVARVKPCAPAIASDGWSRPLR